MTGAELLTGGGTVTGGGVTHRRRDCDRRRSYSPEAGL